MSIKTVVSKFSVCGLTKGNKYGVIAEKGNYYKVCLDDGQIELRHKAAFIAIN